MTPEQWQKVEAVLQEAIDRPPQDRASFLDAACAGDSQLWEEATTLVNAYNEAGDFIEQPAISRDAHILIGSDIADKIGLEIGPYTIVKRLGGGGMGEVYLAQDARLDRLVALKILPAYFASDDARLRRFQREAKAVSALNHPNILTIHEVGEAEGTRYIATEFIEGATIRQLLAKQELSLDEILDIAEQICSALVVAHVAGIVHRDIKPENIMRRADGLVKILDFGIAKLMEPAMPDPDEAQPGNGTHTEAGLLLGTTGYMSPEQARGLPVDERTDIWSLGVVVYEMLAQRLPFSGATRMDTIVAILHGGPSPLSEAAGDRYQISDHLEQTINSCLRKDMTDRLGSATELLGELKRVREQLNNESYLPGSAIKLGRQETGASSKLNVRSLPRRYSWPLLVLVLVLLAAIAGSILYRRSGTTLPSSPALSAGVPTGTTSKLYSQMNEAEQLDFVDQQEQRISMMMGDRPVKLNAEAVRVIKSYVDQFVAHDHAPPALGSASINDVYARARPYVPLIARSFAARKVPIIIGIYLPVIESAYRNCYENSIGAKGLFQFMPQTADRYGVARQDMCDVEKMTPAAAHYMADSMAELGEDSQSMTLVLLSYNRGAESVRNNLRQLRDAENYERNFWTLFAHRNELDDAFRNEGAHYVPGFFAAAIIGENPQNFGLPLPPISRLAE
ncbi:MAG TPA: serine/threonine-protein kinase [Pyrinomonadaceae bacterium]|nr:serine/threonine-protein kinase [Pyrinomonadaceae bacterium]